MNLKTKKKIAWLFQPWVMIALLTAVFTPYISHAGDEQKKNSSFRAGVLELSGSTSFSVNYQKEGGQETTHIRLSPSLGYFVIKDLEVYLKASYIFDNIYHPPLSAGVLQTSIDRSQRFLFVLGPLYNFTKYSDVFIPYAALLLGTYYQKVTIEYSGSISTSRSDLQFALGLEAGARWMITENFGAKAGFQYIHGFEEEFIGSTDFFGLEIGISLFIPTWPSY